MTHIDELSEQLGIDKDTIWMIQSNVIQEMLTQFFDPLNMKYLLIYGKEGESMGVLGNVKDLEKMRQMASVAAGLLKEAAYAEGKA